MTILKNSEIKIPVPIAYGNKVILQKLRLKESKTKSGLIIMKTLNDSDICFGKILSVGDLCHNLASSQTCWFYFPSMKQLRLEDGTELLVGIEDNILAVYSDLSEKLS